MAVAMVIAHFPPTSSQLICMTLIQELTGGRRRHGKPTPLTHAHTSSTSQQEDPSQRTMGLLQIPICDVVMFLVPHVHNLQLE